MHYILASILCYVLGSTTLSAATYYHERPLHLWDVNELNMEYLKYSEIYRDPYLVHPDGSPMHMDYGAALEMDLSVLKWGYWNNRFHMGVDDNSHVRSVGWQWEAGLTSQWVDIFHQHHSQHGMEYVNPRGDGFPLVDAYGVRVKFITGGK